jgi:hypothetical protein
MSLVQNGYLVTSLSELCLQFLVGDQDLMYMCKNSSDLQWILKPLFEKPSQT